MLQKTKGLILKARNIGENDKIVTILTGDLGVIEAAARRAKSVKSPLTAASQILCYSEFCLFKGKQSYYIIDSAETINAFYSLRCDVEKLALAGYFCELTDTLSPSAETSAEFLRLLLNTIHKLEEGKMENNLLKAIFELRALSAGGFMPDLVGCTECGEYEKKPLYFLPLEGILICGDCFRDSPYDDAGVIRNTLVPPVTAALRHIVYSDLEKLFSFRLAEESLKKLSRITENYALLHTDKKFKSLDIYLRLSAGIMPG